MKIMLNNLDKSFELLKQRQKMRVIAGIQKQRAILALGNLVKSQNTVIDKIDSSTQKNKKR